MVTMSEYELNYSLALKTIVCEAEHVVAMRRSVHEVACKQVRVQQVILVMGRYVKPNPFLDTPCLIGIKTQI